MNLRVGAADAAIGASLADIDTPALLIDAAALEANIAALAELCAGKSPRLRPHTKTHKSPIVARLQQAAGAVGVCCAKLAEAEALAADGIGDLLVTTPIASCDSGPPAVKTCADLVFEFAGDEHGSVQRRDGGVLDLRPGDRLELVPSHCDTTVNLYDCYTVIRDKQVDALWPIAARGCSR